MFINLRRVERHGRIESAKDERSLWDAILGRLDFRDVQAARVGLVVATDGWFDSLMSAVAREARRRHPWRPGEAS